MNISDISKTPPIKPTHIALIGNPNPYSASLARMINAGKHLEKTIVIIKGASVGFTDFSNRLKESEKQFRDLPLWLRAPWGAKKTRLPRKTKKPFKKLIEQKLGKKVKNSFLVLLYNSQKDFKRKKFEPFPLELDKDGNLPITNKRDWMAMLMNGKGCAIRPEYGASIILDNSGI